MSESPVVLPMVDDVDTAGFWAAAKRHELAIQRCVSCGQVLHLPKAYCHNCGGWDTTWEVVSPTGTLYSWTTVSRQIHPAFPAPYTVVLVQLTDLPSVRLAGHLPGAPDLEAGAPMVATFDDIGGISIPRWQLADSR